MRHGFVPNRMLAADAFETTIENAITCTQDLYDIDGETFLRNRNGTLDTCDVDTLDMGGQP